LFVDVLWSLVSCDFLEICFFSVAYDVLVVGKS
jgi:hypothetical protein